MLYDSLNGTFKEVTLPYNVMGLTKGTPFPILFGYGFFDAETAQLTGFAHANTTEHCLIIATLYRFGYSGDLWGKRTKIDLEKAALWHMRALCLLAEKKQAWKESFDARFFEEPYPEALEKFLCAAVLLYKGVMAVEAEENEDRLEVLREQMDAERAVPDYDFEDNEGEDAPNLSALDAAEYNRWVPIHYVPAIHKNGFLSRLKSLRRCFCVAKDLGKALETPFRRH